MGKWSPIEREAAEREARRGGEEDKYRWAVAARLPGAAKNRAGSRPLPLRRKIGVVVRGKGKGEGTEGRI